MRILVTGGSGFLGAALSRALLARKYEVASLSRRHSPELSAAGVEWIPGDLADPAIVYRAVERCHAVFHVAAKAGVWGSVEEYTRANVLGTEHVISACRHAGVQRIIYTSSPSVVSSGQDEAGIDESAPYPAQYLAAYPRTKAQAERSVLAANDRELATVALRPHLIWGPGDQHLLPRLIDRARSGRLRRVGDGTNLVDATYIDNAVQAHLCAFDRLRPDADCAGRAYFISNDSPVLLWEFIDRLLGCAGLPPVKRKISAGMAFGLGAFLESLYRLLDLKSEPPMTRFVARQLSTSHWYNLKAAKQDLGYLPQVSVDEGLIRLKSWIQTTGRIG